MLLTPTYHVFHMYKPFRGATMLPVELAAPARMAGDLTVPTVNASAARDAQGRLHLALVNLDPRNAITVQVKASGVSPGKLSGRILTATAMDAINTFDKPENVKPAAFNDARVSAGANPRGDSRQVHHRAQRGEVMNHAFRMKLKPGTVAEYQKRHDEIWPELAKLLTRRRHPRLLDLPRRGDAAPVRGAEAARTQPARVPALASADAPVVGLHEGPHAHPSRWPADRMAAQTRFPSRLIHLELSRAQSRPRPQSRRHRQQIQLLIRNLVEIKDTSGEFLLQARRRPRHRHQGLERLGVDARRRPLRHLRSTTSRPTTRAASRSCWTGSATASPRARRPRTSTPSRPSSRWPTCTKRARTPPGCPISKNGRSGSWTACRAPRRTASSTSCSTP